LVDLEGDFTREKATLQINSELFKNVGTLMLYEDVVYTESTLIFKLNYRQ